jgi:hypothetical protein
VSTCKALIMAAIWSSVTFLSQHANAQQDAAITPVGDSNVCVQPAPLVPVSDIDSRFDKIAAFLTRRIEIKTVHKPYSGKGPPICKLGAREKFGAFVRDGSEPLTFVVAAFEAGLAQVNKDDSAFGTGAGAYGKRLGAALADSASASFLGTFLYPSIFKEDPRFYRQADGSFKRRLGHALTRVFLVRSDSGGWMLNCSELLTTASSTALQSVYHPGNRGGFGPAATRAGLFVATDMGTDVVREFWPDVTRKAKLPFLRRRQRRPLWQGPRPS